MLRGCFEDDNELKAISRPVQDYVCFDLLEVRSFPVVTVECKGDRV
jgi:hypothetical protein